MEKSVKVGLVGASANGSWGSIAHIPALKALEPYATKAARTVLRGRKLPGATIEMDLSN